MKNGGTMKTNGGSDGQRIRIVVIDDHPVVRCGLTTLLNQQPDLEVVGEAGTSAEACVVIAEMEPDLVVLDLELEDAGGVGALAAVREAHPDIPIIVFTAHDEDWRIAEAAGLGVQGYLLKRAIGDGIFQAIRAVRQGGSFFDPTVVTKIMQQLGRRSESRPARTRTLTARERNVLSLLAEGKRNKEISDALLISETAVKHHVRELFAKLRASNRTEAVKVAVEEGIIRL